MTPAPAVGLLWTLIDIVLCRFSVLHPIYYLVESTLLMAFNIAMGIISVMLYRYLTAAFRNPDHTLILYTSWDSSGSWVPGIFILISGVV